ncbi:MAG: hypothetical protein JNL50_06190 [Phycisphaerae bacterium]|nr:hypothetical protein [Phycisphaerae bacterium]
MGGSLLIGDGGTFHDVASVAHAAGAACSLTLGLIEASYKGSKIGRFVARWFPRVVSPASGRVMAAAALLGGGVLLGATALKTLPSLGGAPGATGSAGASDTGSVPVWAELGAVLVVPPFLNSTDRRAPIDVDVAVGDGIASPTRSVRVERYGRDAQDRTMQLVGEIKPDGVALIDRSRFDRFLDEFKFSESGMVSQDSAIRVGKQLGARYVLLGEIKKLSITERRGVAPDGQPLATHVAEIEISFKLQNVETSEVIGTVKATGRDTKLSRLPDADMISGAFDDAFEKLATDAKLSGSLKKLTEQAE